MSQNDASKYEMPFEYAKQTVYPIRSKNRRRAYADKWWQYAEARPGMRHALIGRTRFIVTPRVSKHRLFMWMNAGSIANDGTIVFARDDDYFFGVLHSVAHERWALELGTQLEDRPRYTPTTCFETFPLPKPDKKQEQAVAAAAKELNKLREEWLNPDGISEAELKKRTLTNLYNQRPTWLHTAHLALDRAVLAAYGWSDINPEHLYATKIAPAGVNNKAEAAALEKSAEAELLKRLLKLNHERAAQEAAQAETAMQEAKAAKTAKKTAGKPPKGANAAKKKNISPK